MIKRIVFWEPSVSPHKTPLFKAIKQLRPNVELLHIAQSEISPERQAMGWISSKPDGYEQIVNPDNETCKAAISDRATESFHVFSGMRHVPCIVEGLRQATDLEVSFAIMSEPRVDEGLHGLLRYIESWVTEGKLRNKCAGVFAIGRNGPTWFRSVGYQPSKVFPFAYFIDPFDSIQVSTHTKTTSLRIGYLGRLVRSKGIFALLDAFKYFSNRNAELHLAGPMGDEEPAIRAAIQSYDQSVVLHGAMPMTQVATFLNSVDVLVLPSITKDGWGVAVTEALMVGLPVVTTTCVGASLVLNDKRLGVSVAPNSAKELALGIRAVTCPENLTAEVKTWRKDWANAHLSARAGASYFWAVLDHCTMDARLPPPFYQQVEL